MLVGVCCLRWKISKQEGKENEGEKRMNIYKSQKGIYTSLKYEQDIVHNHTKKSKKGSIIRKCSKLAQHLK